MNRSAGIILAMAFLLTGSTETMAVEEAKYEVVKKSNNFETWISSNGLKITGDPIWARYNPPFTPWFLRRNEILIPVDTGTD